MMILSDIHIHVHVNLHVYCAVCSVTADNASSDYHAQGLRHDTKIWDRPHVIKTLLTNINQLIHAPATKQFSIA